MSKSTNAPGRTCPSHANLSHYRQSDTMPFASSSPLVKNPHYTHHPIPTERADVK
jgi:hypothetical protein